VGGAIDDRPRTGERASGTAIALLLRAGRIGRESQPRQAAPAVEPPGWVRSCSSGSASPLGELFRGRSRGPKRERQPASPNPRSGKGGLGETGHNFRGPANRPKALTYGQRVSVSTETSLGNPR
jgi:hypothetical protein